MEAQNKRIRQYLESGKKLTPLDALHAFNCFRLSARVNDLKHEGLNIETEMIEIMSDGKKKHVAKYSIKK
jgi:hypothetical protein